MALITLVQQSENNEWIKSEHNFDGLAYEFILKNIELGVNFAVYDGLICEQNEISRTDKIKNATDCTIFILPSWAAVPYIIAVIVSVAISMLMPTPDLDLDNSNFGSPNNALSDRKNKARINRRIVDIVGEVKSIPDVIQPEYSFYNADKIEVRVGAYCVGRKQLDIAELRDGDNLIEDINGASAGIYYPFKSPNNSAPDVQIGDAINQKVVGVYQSTNAVGQTLESPNVKSISLTADVATIARGNHLTENLAFIRDPNIDFSTEYAIGDFIDLADVYVGEDRDYYRLGNSSKMEVVGNQLGYLELDTTNNPEFNDLPDDYVEYNVLGLIWVTNGQAEYPQTLEPQIESPDFFVGDTYRITREKVNRLLFNVNARSGIYKRSSGAKQTVSVDFKVAYWLLNDNLERIGNIKIVSGNLTAKTDDDIGVTVDIDLESHYFVEWYIYRTSFTDEDYSGTVVDTLKLKSMFGLFNINRDHFGDVTIIQTKRLQLEQVTAINNPEVNCIATEMIYKYLGYGQFDTVLTKNTQAMQSLIRIALDEKNGRLTVDDLDLDLLLQTQGDIETYYNNDKAGRCCYSFDDQNTSAQDLFSIIANSANVILWREGRLLKSWFERPQLTPNMVFTHRSKVPDSETWARTFNLDHDGVEFKYIDETSNLQEVLLHPESSVNPKTIDIKGVRGIEQATWRMMREYNKLQHQKLTVDFTATAEGRFVRPAKLISVVKGSRTGSFDGYVRNAELLTVELSQEVEFTAEDDHYIIFKQRDGGTESVFCFETANKRIITLAFAPTEPLYFGNDELKTEFSFANEARLEAQKILPQSIDASDQYSTKITGINYSPEYYKDDPIQPQKSSFDASFDGSFF